LLDGQHCTILTILCRYMSNVASVLTERLRRALMTTEEFNDLHEHAQVTESRGPFLTSPLGANFDPPDVNFVPSG
jgi:hypothetical protein